MPDNVGPVRWFNKIAGTCLVIIGAVTSIPVGFALYHGGLAGIFDWPGIFDWFSAFAALFFACGLYLLATPQHVGGWVTFRGDGFAIRVRNLVHKDLDLDVDWSDVQKIELFKGARQPDGLTITLAQGAKVSFATGYFAFGGDEILARLSAAADAAGYRFERDRGFNALVVEKRAWRVVRAT